MWATICDPTDFINNTCYSSFCRKKFFKIKINKIISKINNVPKKTKKRLSGLAILSIKNEILKELEHKNLISLFASKNTRKINFK